MEGAAPATEVGTSLATVQDKGDVILVCHHHGHFEVSAVPPPPLLLMGGEVQTTKSFKQKCL